MDVPDCVTHYYLADRRPFLNLSDVDGDAVFDVMHDLNALRREGLHKRTFGRTYIQWRRLTEARLRAGFIAAGGQPERTAPHYFCLGESSWFAGLADNMLSLSLPVGALPLEQSSFTLVDSFSAMGLGPQFGFPAATEPHHKVVYPLSQLRDVVRRHGLPAATSNDYGGFERRLVDTYVEVQVWTDEPVRQFLSDDVSISP
ncbi:MAG: hypothetical protein JJD92_09810 [Frankiaceae bacterium]|nr:hypothetical protein [Frankiaceae bacterium]